MPCASVLSPERTIRRVDPVGGAKRDGDHIGTVHPSEAIAEAAP